MTTMYDELRQALQSNDTARSYTNITAAFDKLSIQSFTELTSGPFHQFLTTILTDERLALWQKYVALMPTIPYSTSSNRRSYRAPQAPSLYTGRLSIILYALATNQPMSIQAIFTSPVKKIYNSHLYYYATEEQQPLCSIPLFTYTVAILLSERDPQIEAYVNDILWKNGAHDLFDRPLIRAIMMSTNATMHQQLANVLKAASNQEGVRQAIVEVIDEGSLEAQRYFMQFLLTHNYSRFSAVARAIDVWFGLGYEATEQKNLNYVLDTAVTCLQQQQKIDMLLQSESNLDVFIALWALGTQDVHEAIIRMPILLKQASHIQQTALYAALQMDADDELAPLITNTMLETTNIKTFLFGFRIIASGLPTYFGHRSASVKQLVIEYFTKKPWLRTNLQALLQQIEHFNAQINGQYFKINETPFNFLNWEFSKSTFFKFMIASHIYHNNDDILHMIAEQIPKKNVEERTYFYDAVTPSLNSLPILLQALKDRSSSIRKAAIDRLSKKNYPLEQIADAMIPMLNLKSGETRQAVITLLAKQPIDKIEAFVEPLLHDKKELVRIAALELMLTIKDDLRTPQLALQIKAPTPQEQRLIEQIIQEDVQFVTDALLPITYIEQPDPTTYFTFKQLIHFDFEPLRQKLVSLQQLIEDHAHLSYQIPYNDQHIEETLVGEALSYQPIDDAIPPSLETIPYGDLWIDWLLQSNITNTELYAFHYLTHAQRYYYHRAMNEQATAFMKTFLDGINLSTIQATLLDERYKQQIATILTMALQNVESPRQQQVQQHLRDNGLRDNGLSCNYPQFCSSMLLHFAKTEDNIRDINAHSSTNSYITDLQFFQHGLHVLCEDIQTTQDLAQLLYTIEQLYPNDAQKLYTSLPTKLLLIAYDEGFLHKEHIQQAILHYQVHRDLLNERYDRTIERLDHGDVLRNILTELEQLIITTELARGDMETPVSDLVRYLRPIEGIDYFIEILVALGNNKLSRSYSYSANVRNDSLSLLLNKTRPDPHETDAYLVEKLHAANIAPARLIEAMLYNTYWIPVLSRYLQWDGLENVAWYFIAHTTESTNDFEKAFIQQHSAIPLEDFERGAFDRDWFLHAYSLIEPQHFKTIFTAAKYSASGSNHRRAQLYAQASLGELDTQQLKAAIIEKRNQDKLRAYSLVPITATQAKERYLFFQQFIKESKQFGAQRRESEKMAAEMALSNLAKQVSGGNVTQFMWQMELEHWHTLKSFLQPTIIEDITLQLIPQHGSVTLNVIKNGKQLKNVPAKLKKHETIIAMQQAKKDIVEQYRRARLQLEIAMCEETQFDVTVVQQLLHNDILCELLTTVVWLQQDTFFIVDKDGICRDIEGQPIALSGAIQLAHPAHLYTHKTWRQWQHFAFDAAWQQPFKQLFREFYVASDEEQNKTFTNRFEGYQIQPQKAAALLKSRGWKSGYYEPLRKISYHYNFVTTIDFMYDYYTAAEVEAPTLENIFFHDRLTYKAALIQDIPAVYFSEVMRDIDLVVSVAHAGDVDPEASHSTIEMRAVIVDELATLLELDNVVVKEPHILISGSFGQYSIHLGSGNVHQLGGMMIPVSSVPSDHRGRVFLPFIDEDPKTAEICAKLLLFADDAAINDPKIRQLIIK